MTFFDSALRQSRQVASLAENPVDISTTGMLAQMATGTPLSTFAVLVLIGLILTVVLSAAVIVFVLWVAGLEVPGLSTLLKRVSGRTPSGPSLTEFFGDEHRPLMALLSGWVVLWVVLAVTFLIYPAQTQPLPIRFVLMPEGGLGPQHFVALTLLSLIIIALITVGLVVFLLWVRGVQVPGITTLRERVTGQEPEGPTIAEVLDVQKNKPLLAVLTGWILLWVVLVPVLWFYPEGGIVLAERPPPTEPAQAAQPTATPDEAPAATASPAEPAPGPAPTPPDTVMQALSDNGCGGCHVIDGVAGMTGSVGPELTTIGAVAAERIEASGYTGSATTPEEYIHESIVDPSAYVVPDYQDIMPKGFDESIPQEQLDALVDYLAGLE